MLSLVIATRLILGERLPEIATMSKIVVGMSGGVDSSVAAALLKEEGHAVIGISMRIWDGDPYSSKCSRHSCYGPGEEEDIRDANTVADKLGIPFHVLDLRNEYKTEVLNYVREEYLSGRTPNPCVRCNRRIKFNALLTKALDYGIDFDHFATGHYVRVEYNKCRDRYLLRKAVDAKKDQSYFLFALSQKQLSQCIFPLGNCNKDEVRALARSFGFVVQEKAESQDFADGGYLELVKDGIKPGLVMDVQGNVLGEHQGVVNYTVGQRRGLGIATGQPLYVTAIDSSRNIVVVGPRIGVYSNHLMVSGLNWMAIEQLQDCLRVKAKVRYAHKPADAIIFPSDNAMVSVEFNEPQFAVAPGQSIVFYDDDVVVGGGTIEAKSSN